MLQSTRDRLLCAYTFVALGLSIFGYYLYQSGDPLRCNTLLEDGFWLNPDALSNWQPAGCMLHTYRPKEAQSCLDQRRVVFLGGDTTLNLFNGLATKIQSEPAAPPAGTRSNHLLAAGGVNMEFIWDPHLNSSQLNEISTGYSSVNERPALTVIGLEREIVPRDARSEQEITRIDGIFSKFSGSAETVQRQSDATIFVPVHAAPHMTHAEDFAAQIEAFNNLVVDASYKYNVGLLSSLNQVLALPTTTNSELHISAKPLNVLSDILLNRRCNLGLPKHYPYASTCCNTYPSASWVQIAGALFVAVMVPVAAGMYHVGYTSASSTILRLLPASRHLWSIFVMGATVLLCYLCDRTNILGKEQKQTSASQFFYLMAAIILGSFVTTKTETKDQPFLNRDQTDEWKGWMQVAILVYHYVGVSKTEYIYNYMRVMPTSYLFMTGFGHTVYFLKKNDFSFKRYVATMLRLNLLNVVLAYAMGNDWLLYYFAPLVTWNFHVAFFLLWLGNKHNKNYYFLFGKMAVVALLNTAFWRVPGVWEAFWSACQFLFKMQGDSREARFRITLDQYSMFPGMVAAVLFLNWNSYSLPKSKAWPTLTWVFTAVSAAVMIAYAFFETSQPSKQIYNSKHTYVSWLPCCAFVIIRNATPWLRRTHNGFFAWVGRGSLETFLLQFHLWLAADTAGLLMIGPPHLRLLNAMIATPIFFWVASLTTNATGGVIEWIMGAQPKKAPATLPQTNVPSSLGKEGAQISAAEVQTGAEGAEKQASAGEVPNAGTFGKLAAAASADLRVRVGVILLGMVLANWAYYL